ncbi:MAG: glycosyltransferase family 4 protein [Deltaproteobacteria bacterium]|nr:glycosyltransferase family 4 protein [Deltaproteobacteria bacterium]
MRIGFDISQTGSNKAGCGYFADSLILALSDLDTENEYILYPHFGTTFWDPNAERNTRKINRPNISRKRMGRDFESAFSFWENLPADAEERLGNPDVIHANNYSCPSGFKKARVVYALYDLSFFDYPDLTTEENRSKCFGGVFSAAVSADFILSISEYSLTRFLETYPHYPKERTGVAHLGSRFFSAGPNGIIGKSVGRLAPDKFWLSVCTLEPRKNLRRLLRAFREYLKSSEISYPLVLAGGEGWMEGELDTFIEQLDLSGYVLLPGYVSDEKLCWLYKNCFAFVYPSLYEGFGLPVLEAMGFGAAVITSDTTSLPEVAGDAVHYVDPLKEDDTTRAFLKLGVNEAYRQILRKKAITRAKRFSWEKSAQKVLSFYKQVIAMPKFAP